MDMLLIVVAIALLYYFRNKWTKYLPNVVKNNKLLFGLIFGVLLCYFMKNNVEGWGQNCNPDDLSRANDEGGECRSDCDCKTGLICQNGICTPGDESIRNDCCPEGDQNQGDFGRCMGLDQQRHKSIQEFFQVMQETCIPSIPKE